MQPIKEERTCYDQLAIVEKYNKCLYYLYNILQNFPSHHRVLRDVVLSHLFSVTPHFNLAAKTGLIRKLYDADAALADVRNDLEVMSKILWNKNDKGSVRTLLAANQREHCEAMLYAVGGMLNAWIRHKNEGRNPKGQTGS